MDTSSRDDTLVSIDFDNHLLVEPRNPLGISGKILQSIPESANNHVKPPHDVLEYELRKEEQGPDSLKCVDNGNLMRDKVSILDKIDVDGKQVDQTTSSSGKFGDDDNPGLEGFIEFKDCVGRRFKFPYKGIKKWKVKFFLSKDSSQVWSKINRIEKEIAKGALNLVIVSVRLVGFLSKVLLSTRYSVGVSKLYQQIPLILLGTLTKFSTSNTFSFFDIIYHLHFLGAIFHIDKFIFHFVHFIVD